MSTSRRNSRLLLYRDCACYTVGACVQLRRRFDHQTTMPRRRPSPQHPRHQYNWDPRTCHLQLPHMRSGRRSCFIKRRPWVAPSHTGYWCGDVFNNGEPALSPPRSRHVAAASSCWRRSPGEGVEPDGSWTFEWALNGVSYETRFHGDSYLEEEDGAPGLSIPCH